MAWPLVIMASGARIFSQSMRMMRSTESTRKAWVLLLNSVTIIESYWRPAAPGAPMNLPSEMMGMMLPRREITPSTPKGMLGDLVISGVWETSRTLKTLMPNVSRVPSENSRISILLEPASLVRASTLASRETS